MGRLTMRAGGVLEVRRAPRSSGQALVVDPIKCDGYGMCAELLPEWIALDDWGYPMLREGALPVNLLDHARRAVDVCPVLALRLRRVLDGEPARAAVA